MPFHYLTCTLVKHTSFFIQNQKIYTSFYGNSQGLISLGGILYMYVCVYICMLSLIMVLKIMFSLLFAPLLQRSRGVLLFYPSLVSNSSAIFRKISTVKKKRILTGTHVEKVTELVSAMSCVCWSSS